jgi:hypothetical protein
VRKIFNQNFPIQFLQPFYVNFQRIREIDEELLQEKDVPLTKKPLNLLKQIYVVNSNLLGNKKNGRSLINFFDGLDLPTLNANIQSLTYSKALEICRNQLNAKDKLIYKALWIGSTPGVDLIKPADLPQAERE